MRTGNQVRYSGRAMRTRGIDLETGEVIVSLSTDEWKALLTALGIGETLDAIQHFYSENKDDGRIQRNMDA